MADGKIVIQTSLDNSDLEKQLKQNKGKIADLNDEYRKQQAVVRGVREELARVSREYGSNSEKAEKVRDILHNEEETLQEISDEIYKQKRTQDATKEALKEQNAQRKLEGQNIKASLIDMQGVGDALKKGLKTLLRYSLALIGIRSLYFGLKNVASIWLNSNDESARQLKANLDYMKWALGSALKPIIETIVKLLYYALQIVNMITMALFKMNLFENASVDNFNKMNKSAGGLAKTMKNVLASFDELNVLQEDSENGGGLGGATTPDIDLSQWNDLENIFDGLKDKIKDLLPLAEDLGILILGWKNNALGLGASIIKFGFDIKNSFKDGRFDATDFMNTLLDLLMAGLFTYGLTGGNLLATGIVLDIGLSIILGCVIGDAIITDSNRITPKLIGGKLLKKAKEKGWITDDGKIELKEIPVALGISTISLVSLPMESINIIAEDLGNKINKALDEFFGDNEDLQANGGKIIVELRKGLVEMIANPLDWMIPNIWTPLNKAVDEMMGIEGDEAKGVFRIADALWNGIKNATIKDWNKMIEWFKENVSPKLTYEYWQDKLSAIKDAIPEPFRQAFKSVAEIVEKALNFVIDKVNTIQIKLPDKVKELTGWGDIGFNIPRVNLGLPKLAKGGIAYQPTQAIIGERGREAVLPLENNTEWMDALAERLSDQEITINFAGNMAQFVRMLNPEIIKENKRTGRKLIGGMA